MKKLMKHIAVCLLVLLTGAAVAAAQETVIENGINKVAGNLEVPRGTVVNGDVTVNMGEILILGTVNGNVSGNMGQVTIHGDVNGDVEANMGQVSVSGNVSGQIRARMGEVVVDGAVGGDVDAGLGNVRINGTVGGNVNTGLGELRLPGEVLGSVASRGGNIYITGTVHGNVSLIRGIVELGPQAVVGGKVYVEEGLVRAAAGATAQSIEVMNELTEEELRRDYNDDRGYFFRGLDDVFEDMANSLEQAVRGIRIPQFRRSFRTIIGRPFRWFVGWPGSLARGLFNMIVLFALTALTYSLFPRQVHHAGEAVIQKSGAVFGWGILAALLAVPLAFLLAITLIGAPLIIVEVLVLAAAATLGYTAITRLIGERIVNISSSGKANPLGAIALGVLIIGAIGMIPIIGWLFSLVVLTAALGAALATRFGTVPLQPEGAAAETNLQGSGINNESEGEEKRPGESRHGEEGGEDPGLPEP